MTPLFSGVWQHQSIDVGDNAAYVACALVLVLIAEHACALLFDSEPLSISIRKLLNPGVCGVSSVPFSCTPMFKIDEVTISISHRNAEVK